MASRYQIQQRQHNARSQSCVERYCDDERATCEAYARHFARLRRPCAGVRTMIDEWAKEFGVSPIAVAALKARMGIGEHYVAEPIPGGAHDDRKDMPGSEGRQQAL